MIKYDFHDYFRQIQSIKVIPDEGDPIDHFNTIEEAEDFLLEKLHMAGKIFVTYKEEYQYTAERKQKTVESLYHRIDSLTKAIESAIEEGMKGRTFYDNYFSINKDNLSRVDKMNYILLQAIEEK